MFADGLWCYISITPTPTTVCLFQLRRLLKPVFLQKIMNSQAWVLGKTTWSCGYKPSPNHATVYTKGKTKNFLKTIPLPLRRVRWSLFDYSTPKDDYGIVKFFFPLCFSSLRGLSILCKFNLLNFIVQATKPKEGAERGEKPRKLKSMRFYIHSHTEQYSRSMESRSLPKL